MYASKYNGCGNDFMIVDYKEDVNYSDLAIQLCHEAEQDTDGLIVVKNNPLEMLLFNKDGSQAPMCGNGIRCFTKYVRDEKLTHHTTIPVQTLAGEMTIDILSTDPFECKVNIGKADYRNDRFNAADHRSYINRTVEIDGKPVTFTSLFMGTVHTVVFVEDAKAMVKSDLGKKLCQHPLFKEQTNVNFVQVVNRKELIVRTFERGVGWTLACGTGCSASFVVARDSDLVDTRVHVHLEKGSLKIEGSDDIFMSGPAVFEKKIKLPIT
ncbi:diaminopimelate epimerase [Alkalibacterium iburiense]|uniref:Diaminopimelate epimerase n=1 Tax=Alkalibacterium iburiense TaxID=290589 RepID=A0ABN0XMP6_9LACT